MGVSKRVISEYTCVLCGRQHQTPDDETPVGWHGHYIEDKMVDRMGETKYICKECLEQMDKARDYVAGVKIMKSVLAHMPRSTVERYVRGELR